MPRLPSADALGPLPVPQSNRQIVGFDGGAVPRAVEGLGQTLYEVGQKIAQKDDTQAVFEARRKLDDWERTAVYDPSTGVAAKLGRDALDLPRAVSQNFDQFASTVSETLSSPRQRQIFQDMAEARKNQVLDFTLRHSLTQKNVFETGQYKADINASAQRTALLTSAGNSDAAAGEMAVMKTRTIGFLRQQGKSEEEIGMELRDNASKVHMNVLGQMLDNDQPVQADKYLKANAGDMKVEDLLRAQAAVNKQMDARAGVMAATSAVQSLRPLVQPTDLDRLANLAMAAESGGRRYGVDGKILQGPVTRSGERAQGEMQVMPSTAADPGYGIKPADMSGTPEQQANEIARVGRQKLEAMAKRYGGDVSKTLAAYNWGEGNVDNAIKSSQARGANGDWLGYAPPETQAYVAKITKAFGEGGGAPAMPTLQDAHDRVRATLGTGRPQQLATGLADATRQYTDLIAAKKTADEEAVANASRALVANGGNWGILPAAMRNAVPPDKVDSMLNFGDRIAKGQQRTDWGLYGNLIRNPDVLKATNLMAFRDKFEEGEFKQLTDKQAALLKPGADPMTQVQTPIGVIDGMMRQAGIDPTLTDKSSKADAEKVGRLLSAYEDGVAAAEKRLGRKLDTKELRDVAAPLFQPVEINSPFWFNGKKPAGLLDPTDRIAVPEADRLKIVAALRAAGREVTSDAVMTLYRQKKKLPGAN